LATVVNLTGGTVGASRTERWAARQVGDIVEWTGALYGSERTLRSYVVCNKLNLDRTARQMLWYAIPETLSDY